MHTNSLATIGQASGVSSADPKVCEVHRNHSPSAERHLHSFVCQCSYSIFRVRRQWLTFKVNICQLYKWLPQLLRYMCKVDLCNSE